MSMVEATAAPAVAAGRSVAGWTPPLCRLRQCGTIRLIPSGRLKSPVLAPLAASRRALDDLALLEGLTNGRLAATAHGLLGLDPRELMSGRSNDSFVNAAFTHVRPGGNRFNDTGRGAWYAGFDAATSLGEVSYHLSRELDAVGVFDNVTDYAELVADFVGPFHDLTGLEGPIAALGAGIEAAYPAGQALARRLREPLPGAGEGSGSNGLVYPSVRHPGGICLVAFRPGLVQNLRQGGMWRLTWNGSRTPTISRPHGEAPETVCVAR